MLNLPALTTGATGMDQYGFFTLGLAATWPWPLAFSIVLGASSAGVSYLAYRLLQTRAWFAGNRYETYHRNAVIFGTPVAIAFLPTFFLSGYGYKPLALGVAGIMATSLCLTAALNDRETRLDAGMVRVLFVLCTAIILILLVLSISGLLAMYFVEHSPSSGNFFWSWEFVWSDLGYPAEEFSQRHRNGLLAFGIAGTLYMTVALGGSLLGAILRWEKPVAEREDGATAADDVPALLPRGSTTEWLNLEEAYSEGPPAFVLLLNGQETTISRSQYENLLANKTSHIPNNTKLLVNQAAGTAFAKNSDRWEKIPFRGRQKGPFLLLCIYARNPGRPFTASELEDELAKRLPDRDGFNVSDLVTQLRNKGIPVQRDDGGTYLPGGDQVCFLDRMVEPSTDIPEPPRGSFT